MTCIVAIKTKSGIIIGGDTMCSYGGTTRILKNPKVFQRGQFGIGCCDSLRVLQLVRYKFAIPPIKGKELHNYMVTDFIDSLRKCFKIAGAARKEHEEEEVSGEFIVGIRDRLFLIGAGYSVSEFKDDIAACGSVEDYALGSLHSTVGEHPIERVKKALEAAEYFCESVGGPYTILEVKNEPEKPASKIRSKNPGKEKADTRKEPDKVKGKTKRVLPTDK
jgi:ATP-dependent protease HslVU (ClpYQ) peptidase subunit